MQRFSWTSLAVLACAGTLVTAPMLEAAQRPTFGGGQAVQRWPGQRVDRAGFDRGYREGLEQGIDDGRKGRAFDYARDKDYREGDKGYERRDGNRDDYRDNFRRGFAAGYRDGYERERRGAPVWGRDGGRDGGWGQDDRNGRRGPRGYQEPAYARGYSDGYEQGLDDRRDGDRYDPVGHGDYRSADQGYFGNYGSKDAYKNNYRAGYREGYEDGFRGRR